MEMILKQPLNPLEYEELNDLFDDAYTVFQVELNLRDNRPTLFGKRIFIDATSEIDGKIIGFWHAASNGPAEDSKFEMLPCANDDAIGKCIFECNMDHPENFLKDTNRTPCIYRACRVGWISQIIRIADSCKKPNTIIVWTSDNQRGEKFLNLRYRCGSIDYIVIFKISYKNKEIVCFRLITAYPIVLRRYKRRYEKECRDFDALKKKPTFLRKFFET